MSLNLSDYTNVHFRPPGNPDHIRPSRRSGFQSPFSVSGVSEAASLFLGHRALDPGSGLLLAVPIPKENAADGREIEDAIQVGEEMLQLTTLLLHVDKWFTILSVNN